MDSMGKGLAILPRIYRRGVEMDKLYYEFQQRLVYDDFQDWKNENKGSDWMEKLVYGLEVLTITRRIPKLAEGMGLEYADEYLNYHNHICPDCQNKMRVNNGFVENVGSVATSMLPSIKKIVPYVICKKCSKESSKEPEFKRQKRAIKIEDYIGSVIPKLKAD